MKVHETLRVTRSLSPWNYYSAYLQNHWFAPKKIDNVLLRQKITQSNNKPLLSENKSSLTFRLCFHLGYKSSAHQSARYFERDDYDRVIQINIDNVDSSDISTKLERNGSHQHCRLFIRIHKCSKDPEKRGPTYILP